MSHRKLSNHMRSVLPASLSTPTKEHIMSRVTSSLAFALMLAFTGAACSDNPVAVGGDADRADIQKIVDTFDQAWTAGDAVKYAAQYAGAEFVGPTGAISNDPAAITGTYAFIFSVLLPNTKRVSTIRNLTFLTGTIAVLDIDAQVTGFSPQPGLVPWRPGILRALERNIVKKLDGEWRIVLHQQTFVGPE